MGRKELVLAVLAAAAVAGGSTLALSSGEDPGTRVRWDGGSAPAPAGDPVVTLWSRRDRGESLARLDPRTLTARRRLDLGREVLRMTAVSPSGDDLLMVTRRGQVRVVDLRRMRDRARFSLGLDFVHEVAWPEEDVAIVTAGGGFGTRLVRFEPSDGGRLGAEVVPGSAFASAQVGDGLVLLLQDDYTEGTTEPTPTTIAHLDVHGNLSTRRIPAIGSGYYHPDGDESGLGDSAVPALAVTRDHAIVVGTDGTIATVTLDGLDVDVQEESLSLFDRIAAWLVPPAHAKTLGGTTLQAEWLGPHDLLVTGTRVDLTKESHSRYSEEVHPAGALILDTSDWSTEVVDEEANAGRAASGLALVHRVLDVGFDEGDGIGLRAYERDGTLVWSVLDGAFVEILSARDGVALVRHGWRRILISAIDLETGTVLRTSTIPVSLAH